MISLPIKLITRSEQDLVDQNTLNLAKLASHNFPVTNGLVVFPPNLRKYLHKLQIENSEDFERGFEVIREIIYQVPIPDELVYELKKGFHDKKINIDSIWKQLLNTWLEQLRNNQLKSQTIFFAEKIVCSGKIHLEKKLDLKQYVDNRSLHHSFLIDSKIELGFGSLSAMQAKQLEQLAIKMDKLLGISQTYHFIVDRKGNDLKINIVKLSPSTYILEDEINSTKPVTLDNYLEEKAANQDKLALKIFVEYSSVVENLENIDGALITYFEQGKEADVIKIAQNLNGKPLLFKLNSLEDNVKLLMFYRNKQKSLNIFPLMVSPNSIAEFINTKKKIEELGLLKRANCQYWIEFETTENLVNSIDYIELGIDGVVINLDELIFQLSGFDSTTYSNEQIDTLLKFIDIPLKNLLKKGIYVLVKGKLISRDEVLKFLISIGVYGVVIPGDYYPIFIEDLQWTQKYSHRSLLA